MNEDQEITYLQVVRSLELTRSEAVGIPIKEIARAIEEALEPEEILSLIRELK